MILSRSGLLAVYVLVLFAAPHPTCGSTRCDTPLRWAADTAAGLAEAQEKFLSCAQAQPSAVHPERWKPPSASESLSKAPAEPRGGSRLKRPSDVGSMIDRCRRDDALRTPMSSSFSAVGGSGSWSKSKSKNTPERSPMRDDGATPRLRTMLSDGVGSPLQRMQGDGGDAMQESPMLFSSTRSDSLQHDSLSAQATPACYSQTRHTSAGALGQSALKAAGAETPHLRASDWPEDTPERIIPRDTLSQKLFMQDDAQSHLSAQSPARGNLYSAMKAAQQQHREETLPDGGVMHADAAPGMSEYEEEACMLLSTARIELQALNDRWKEAEEARLVSSKEAQHLRNDVDVLQQNADVLEAEKVAIYNELQTYQRLSASLQEELSAAQQQQREAQQRCSSLMAEKAGAEASLAAMESKALQSSQETMRQDGTTASGAHEQKLQELAAQLATVQEERQMLWVHIADMQLAASDAEQMHVSQRQQLKALCSALEASELQREQLEAKALRAEDRCDELVTAANGTALSAAREFELEELLAQANQKEHAAFLETEALVNKYQALEEQLEVQARACEEGEKLRCQLEEQIQGLEKTKKEVDQRVERLTKAHEIANKSFEEELGTWRTQVQELESELNRAQQQRLSQVAAVTASEERLRECEARLQREAEEKILRAQEAGAADMERLKSELDRENELWGCRMEEAKAEAETAAAKLAEMERTVLEEGRRIQQLQNDLEGEQQRCRESMQLQQDLTKQLGAAEERCEEQTAARREQATHLQALEQRSSELEAQVAELEDSRAKLEEQHRDGQAKIAYQMQAVQRKDELEEENAQLQIELAGMAEEKARLERDAQARLCGSKDLEVKLDAAAAESAALVRRCEELRVAFETASASKHDLEQQVAAHKTEIVQLREAAAQMEGNAMSLVQNMTCQVEALGKQRQELEARCRQQEEHAQEQARQIQAGSEECQEARAREAEAQQRCREAEKVAREATRSASKELYLVQAQASHLRQQVDSLTKDKEMVLKDRDEAVKERQALYVTNKQREDEVGRLMEQLRQLQFRQPAEDGPRPDRIPASGGWAREGGVGDVGLGGTGMDGGEDVLQSVIAQRTRRR